MSPFPGFPRETIQFLADLKANNDRAWFAEHRDVYERDVRAPSEIFVATIEGELEAAFGRPVASKMFRVHRDVRFSKDKSPYNAHVHVAFTFSPGAEGRASPCGFYFGLEPSRLHLGAGVFELSGTGLDRYRAVAADDRDGPRLDAQLAGLVADGFTVAEPELKRTPAPYAADHPRAALLRRKGVTAWREVADLELVSSPALAPGAMDAFLRLAPLVGWLEAAITVQGA